MPQAKVRLALVGCGRRGIGVSYLFKGHPHCQITALMDRFEPTARNAAKALDLPGVKIYTDYEQLLVDGPLDAIFFACDPTVQVAMACRAMEVGKHVCTEVPVAFTIEECWNLVRTVKKTGLKYQPLEQTRYWGFVDTWKAMHDRGELGHVCLAQGEYVHYLPNRGNWIDLDTGEMINDPVRPRDRKVEASWRQRLGLAEPIYYLPHTLSPLLKILNDRVVRVSCMGTRPQSYSSIEANLPWRDIEYALMHTAKDTVLLVGAGFSLPHVFRGPCSCHWYELRGTKGSVSSPRHPTDGFRCWKDGMKIYQEQEWSTVPVDADSMQAQSGHGGADFKPVDTFIRSILDDTALPMDVYTAVETAAPAILAAESARREGEALDVPDFRTP